MKAEEPSKARALPTRRRASPQGTPGRHETVAQRPSEAHSVTNEKLLQQIHEQVDRVNITGLLVASRDGLVLCSDTRGVEDDGVAAMAAAAIGLSAQFVGQAELGDPRAAVFEGSLGHIGAFPVDKNVLLVVIGRRNSNMGLFTVAARQALALIQQAIADQNGSTAQDAGEARSTWG
ncbi:roadblock/LC7 domain-containing protein [Kibdelosporangium aridum]|uniref:Roadblock/LAMTOR2 domain-containing protein n=1 Tax=Kibdelosporangium aridum TaxID=2030 RepID=A0A1Y5YCG9_KIBAR|nr:roadblock/LC7 domain-containing protein [Kibdelosporangium aridum]SMD27309.1 hypothetical protein SAMN05661093_10912 [Kibdelosporangium aridum]